jgi:phospholipid transport system substrate-binding protein
MPLSRYSGFCSSGVRSHLLLAGLVLALLLPAFASPAAPASEADQAAARRAVDETVTDVLAVLRNGDLVLAQKRDRIQDIAYERFDFEVISKLVLARNWRRMSAQQRADFETEFKRHLSVTYGDSLDRYSSEAVEVTQARPENNGDVTVRSRVLGNGDPISVDYRLRGRNGRWYVIDVIIEGVSLLSNFRSQTREVIQAEGADGLIRMLREKNDARSGGGGGEATHAAGS